MNNLLIFDQTKYCIQGQFYPVLFLPSGLRVNIKLGSLNYIIKIREWVNSRVGESFSDLYRTK